MFYKVLFVLFISTILLYGKTFSVSYDPDYAPFSYTVKDKPYGLFIDIWKLWAKKNNHQLKFIKAKQWDDAINLAKTKKVDFFIGTEPYEDWMQASRSYYKTKTSLYLLKSFHDKATVIGIIGDDYKQSIENKIPNSKIISFDDYKQLLQALINNKVNAIYDDTLAISYYSIKNGYSHLIKQALDISEISDIDAISASTKNIKIFNDGLKNVSIEELRKIESDWISDKEIRFYTNKNLLKKKEFNYVFDPDWKPFEYKDKMSHMHMGIIADILSLIATKSGLKFNPVKTDTWLESTKLLQDGKVEMVSAVPWTPQRDKYLNFTKKSIYSYPAVLVSTKEYIFNEDFNKKTIGIVRGNSLGKWIQNRYPDSHFVFFKDVKSGFEALEKKKIDFFGINGVSANYYINVVGFSNTKIYTILDYMFHLKIALLKSVDPQVLTLIDDALSNISKKELSDIYHKWTSIQVNREINWELISTIIAIALVVVLIFIFINKKLNKLVKERTAQLKELNENLELKVQERTKELANINKKMHENIKYASLIQNSILPNDNELKNFFEDYFILWEPKDIVGGDIYFFKQIDEHEAFILLIDCTGHGVSGAFVTMLVKAIEEQVIFMLEKDELSPSNILKYFNKSFKKLLSQENTNANVGFDTGVIHINKQTNILTFSGANIPLYYTYNSKLHRIKANRQSIGYTKSKSNYKYEQEQITIEKGMVFYISTDGYIDQNGGKRSFPFGRKRFNNLLLELSNNSLSKQKDILLKTLSSYQNQEERNDDITFIGFSV